MLVLSRKLNESIVINDNVVVTVLGVKGDAVRLGINAPLEIPVHRQEVYEKVLNRGSYDDSRVGWGEESGRLHHNSRSCKDFLQVGVIQGGSETFVLDADLSR